MCIIAIKPAGAKKPTKEMFEAMIDSNPNGFGYMTWNAEQGLQVHKTMNSKQYLKWVEKIPDEQPVVYHMRIATHGSVQTKNCHPFKDGTNTWGFAHNGILSIHNEGDMTDSETFFKRIAMPFIYAGMLPKSSPFDKMIETIIGTSKFVFMHDGQLFMYGNFIQDGDLYFSNDSYKPRPKYSTLYTGSKPNYYGYWNSGSYRNCCSDWLEDYYDDYWRKPTTKTEEKSQTAIEFAKEPQPVSSVIEQAVSTDELPIPDVDARFTYGLHMSDRDFDDMCDFLEEESCNDFNFQFRTLENIITLCEDKFPDADETAVETALSLCEIKYAQPCATV